MADAGENQICLFVSHKQLHPQGWHEMLKRHKYQCSRLGRNEDLATAGLRHLNYQIR